ncbi:MAG: iron transporter permease, partial [Frondihabitans sp.]|nr:iron transporter permease [Frondihabitans sp.]
MSRVVTLTPGRTVVVARRRVVLVSLSVGLAVLALVALGLGDYPLNPLQVIQAAFSHDGIATTIVVDWRLPRVVVALAFGAALGVSGALFQSL